jgi:hypothetical protein
VKQRHGGMDTVNGRNNRVLHPGNFTIFRWYFTGPTSFSGIFRRSTSFDATGSNFPSFSDYHFQFCSVAGLFTLHLHNHK